MSVRSMEKHNPCVSISAAAYEELQRAGNRRSQFAQHLARTLTAFENDPAAAQAFLDRIPTRLISVTARTADRIAYSKERFSVKAGGLTAGMRLEWLDDAINRALDKAEGKR